eukprot:8276999-Karenia_brevis.AAC.1
MISVPILDGELPGDHIHRTRSEARRIILQHATLPSQLALRSQWRYIGHCFRNEQLPFLTELLTFRDEKWWLDQAPNSRTRERHRRCGNQLEHVLKSYLRFGWRYEVEDLVEEAKQKQRWEHLEASWLQGYA